MKDKLQKIANRICAQFGLGRVELQFVEAFSKEDIKVYNFLLAPTKNFESILEKSPGAEGLRRELALIPAIMKEELAKSKKDILWKEFVTNPTYKDLVFKIEEEDVRILEAAIGICASQWKNVTGIGQKLKLSQDEMAIAEGVANKMKEFHAEGLVIEEFENIARLAKKHIGKMPLYEASGTDFEMYIHEVIHYVLYENGVYTRINPFDEGLCTFVHRRFRRFMSWWRGIYPKGDDYIYWENFFRVLFDKAPGHPMVPNREIGPLLRRDIKLYLSRFREQCRV